MNIKTLINLLLLFFVLSETRGQGICKDIVNKYPASVITKIYDLNVTLNLDEGTQKSLALIFSREDSSVVAAIINNRGKSEIDQIHRIAYEAFINLLEENGFDELYYNLSKTDVYSIAYASARSQSSLVGGDSLMERDLGNIYYNKYLEIEKVKKRLKYNEALSSNLIETAIKYDSLLFKTIKRHRLEKYFTQRIMQLDSVKTLNDKEKRMLKIGFNNLCIYGGNYRSYADNFNQILHQLIKDTIYYSAIYHKEIANRAIINSKKSASTLRRNYKVSKASADALASILYEKEKKLAIIYYSFPIYVPKKDTLENSTITYYDSLVDNFLYCEGVKTPNSHFFIAVRHKDRLKLSSRQVDTLVNKGFKFEHLINLKKDQNDISFNPLTEQRSQIKQILSEEQLYELVRLVNKEPAMNYALLDWKEMKSYNLVTPSDSAKIVPQLFHYQWNKIVIRDFYKDDARMMWERYNAFEETKPTLVKELQAARKIEASEKKIKTSIDQTDKNNGHEANNNALPKQESNKKTYRGTYQW